MDVIPKSQKLCFYTPQNASVVFFFFYPWLSVMSRRADIPNMAISSPQLRGETRQKTTGLKSAKKACSA